MGVIFSARQRHFRRIVAVKRVLVYHGDSPRKNARATSAAKRKRPQGWIIPTSCFRPDI
jgi:hypothetical protein